MDPSSLVAALADGDRRALARAISIVEDERQGFEAILSGAFSRATPALRVGITGAPGAGKSTITDALVTSLRDRGERVAVLAVDPTSPFSGGAVLGDRVRMQDHVLDDGVFIRSMASRGHLGGLSAAAPKALVMLEAAGFPVVLIETVGVGQDEVEVTASADTVVVVVTPGWGDGIQAAKAGILEIGDVFAVNKADRVGAADAVADLKGMLALGDATAWTPPIVETVATERRGIAELWEAVESHRAHLGDEGLEDHRRRRRRVELETALRTALELRAAEMVSDADEVRTAVEKGSVDPWSAAREIIQAM